MALLNNELQQASLSGQAVASTQIPHAIQDQSSAMLIGKTPGSKLGVYFYQNKKDPTQIMYSDMVHGKNMEPMETGNKTPYDFNNFNFLNPDMSNGETWIGADKSEWIKKQYTSPSLQQVRDETLKSSNFDPTIHEPIDFKSKLDEFNRTHNTTFGPEDVGGGVIFGNDSYYKSKRQQNLPDYSKDLYRSKDFPSNNGLINNKFQQAR